MRDLVKESFPKIEQLFEQKRLITGVPTGFVDLDAMTRGFQAGDLIIIAARPSMGKTSLVLNIAQYVALQPEHTVGVFSLEMSKESLFLRLLTSEAQIDSHRLMSGAIGQKDYARISHALETLSAMRLHIDDTASLGVLEMRAKARRLQAEHGLSLLVVDYIQLMSGRGRFENRTLELGCDLALAERARQGAQRAGRRAVAVEPRAGGAFRPPAAALRPARVRRARAGRRRRHADLPGGCLQPGSEPSGCRAPRSSSSPSSATARPASCGSRSCGSRRDSPISRKARDVRSTVARVDLAALQSNFRAIRIPRHCSRTSARIQAVPRAATVGRHPARPDPAWHHRRRQSQRLRARRRACGARAGAGGRDDARVRRYRGRHRPAAGGVRVPILVFGALSVSDLDGLFEFALTPTISTPSAARAVQAAAASAARRRAATTSRSTPA